MTEIETKALSYLPPRLADAVVQTVSLHNTAVDEIRLRENRLLSLTTAQANISCSLTCTREEIARTVAKLCGNSLYSHSESIRDGYILTDCGIRVGVCGHAVISDGKITLVRDITSLNIRIPHRVPGAADRLYSFMRQEKGKNVLIYSAPGMGKTTVLRELIPLLSSAEDPHRIAVIDTRYELCVDQAVPDMTDVFLGYPRYEGILSAVRTMSPEYILCDEISTEQDVRALSYAHSAGISVCATIHAKAFPELTQIALIAPLLNAQLFDLAYGIPFDRTKPDIRNLHTGEVYDS